MSDAMGPDKRKGLGMTPPVPKKAAPAIPEEPDVPPLTPEQIESMRVELEERRASLLVNIEKGREQERDQGREVGDEMDEASLEGTTSMTSKLLERDARLLAEINRALAKLRDGTYGICEGTGEPIGFARLRLRPWARYSIAYQEELEREERTRGGP
jgi:DnaK suppressor protein